MNWRNNVPEEGFWATLFRNFSDWSRIVYTGVCEVHCMSAMVPRGSLALDADLEDSWTVG